MAMSLRKQRAWVHGRRIAEAAARRDAYLVQATSRDRQHWREETVMDSRGSTWRISYSWPLSWPIALLLLATPALAQDAPTVPAPVSGPAPTSVSILAGGLVTMGGEESAVTPLARIAVDMPLAQARLSPRLHVVADLTALPGEAVELSDPTTFRAVEFRLGVSQRVGSRINAALYGSLGYATRAGTDPAPRARAARFANAGVLLGGARGWLALGCGVDQRLGRAPAGAGEAAPVYQPACVATGALTLWRQEGGPLKGGSVVLIGESVLGLDLSARWPGYSGGTSDIHRLAVVVGRP